MGFFDFLNKKKIGVPEVYQNADFKDYKSYATIQDGKLLRLDVQKKATQTPYPVPREKIKNIVLEAAARENEGMLRAKR